MRLFRCLLACALLGFMVVGGPSVATPVSATANWTPPTTGSPVHHYRVELKTDAGPFVIAGMPLAPSITLTLESGHTYVVRVAGIDAQDRQGPFSDPSEPYTPDLGAPGGCGKPIVVQN